MNDLIHRVAGFEIVGPYSLRVKFEDGLKRTIDLGPVLAGELFGPLRDRSFFERVRLDTEAQTLVWPNVADFDPAALHDWPQFAEAFSEQARLWHLAPT
jgi:hypothetical protein